jgi:carbonic anhydrase
MSATEELIHRYENIWLPKRGCRKFSEKGDDIILPSKGITIVACMDARVDPYDIFGLKIGEAHVIRNAGGVVDNSALRSLVISQEVLGTKEIIVMRHRDCGMTRFLGDDFRRALVDKTGQRPSFEFEDTGLRSSELALREDIRRIYRSPFIRHKSNVSAWIYNDCDGELIRIDISDLRGDICRGGLNPNCKPLAFTGELPLYKPRSNGKPGGDLWDPFNDPLEALSVCYLCDDCPDNYYERKCCCHKEKCRY